MKLLKRLKCNKKSKAQSLIEYALILAMVTVIAITALQLLGSNMAESLNDSASTMKSGSNSVQEQACKSFKGTWDGKTKTCTPPASSTTP